MQNLFDFNHIDPSISKETQEELKKLYKYYHKLWWCHRKLWKGLKKSILLSTSSPQPS